MCGIAGNINVAGKVSAPAIHAMLLDMQHRGDTAPRVEDLTWAAIGCVRLKIVDVDCASQPMTDKDGLALIAFNGEIYNFLELKAELEELGRVFQYSSDTEVLLYAFLEWGKACLSRLQGMYAFVILDLRRRSYFAARDPLGIKPFYYGHNGNEWLFSSEIHPLTMSGVSDVRSLPGGAFVVDGIVSERTYLPELRPKPSSFNDVRAILRSKIRESVRSHLQTDFPVAVLCSGGIDSSIVLYEAFQAKPDLVTAFSVGTINAEDHVFAQRLASKLGIPFVFIEISEQEMVNGISQAVRCIESFEPNHIRAGTTGLALARAVKQHGFKIALLGEGADELFGGYGEFPTALREEGSLESVELLLRRFTEELQQTQLQRVDRTMMNSTIEGRVPFLHLPLVQFVQNDSDGIQGDKDGRWAGGQQEYFARSLPRHLA